MTTPEKDHLAIWLQSCPDPVLPPGFAARLQERLSCAPEPVPIRHESLQISGALCIASAFVLFIVLHTPLQDVIPQIIQALEGVL